MVVVACDEKGNIDLDDLKEKINQHMERVAAIMVLILRRTVYLKRIAEICG